ncbi:MAG TPA: hypothetical protein VF084_04460 [Nitrososphaeraceae archaeon]
MSKENIIKSSAVNNNTKLHDSYNRLIHDLNHNSKEEIKRYCEGQIEIILTNKEKIQYVIRIRKSGIVLFDCFTEDEFYENVLMPIVNKTASSLKIDLTIAYGIIKGRVSLIDD